MAEGQWRRCSACKQPIELGATYWACNVSTCNRKRTGLAFCSVTCWEVHLPGANHRESWAVEKRAPREPEPAAPPPRAPRRAGEGSRRHAPAAPAAPAAKAAPTGEVPKEVLVVASRLKEYVRASSGFNTSERVLGPLSEIVRRVADEAVRNAERDGRKTILDRDIPRRS